MSPFPRFLLPLYPAGLLYLGASRLRALWYERLSTPIDLGRPTISVGNLSFGGTGKTPVSIALAQMLSQMLAERGLTPAILLRGYGRTTRGALMVAAGSSPEEVGDEALLLARRLPGVAVIVGERREEAAALAPPSAGAFVLDDAFQHLRVRRDADLLLVDASRPGDLHAPPLGRLREPPSAARRASAILVTRGEAGDLPKALRPFVGSKPLLGARFSWAPEPRGTGAFTSWSALARVPIVAFAGIGHPAAFFAQAEGLGLIISAEVIFPDHARANAARLAQILKEALAAKAGAVLTTEKDAVKWGSIWPGDAPPLVYPVQEVELSGDIGGLRTILAAACARGVGP